MTKQCLHIGLSSKSVSALSLWKTYFQLITASRIYMSYQKLTVIKDQQ